MGRLRALSGAEVCAILAQQGFERVRQHDSHVIMQRASVDSTTTVPVPDHKELATGTLRYIIRQSGLSRSYFEVE